MTDKPPARLILLDAGLVTELDAADRRNFLDLFTAVALGDGRLAAQLMVERSRSVPVTIRPAPSHPQHALCRCLTWWCRHVERSPGTVVDPDGFVRAMDELIGQVQQRTFRVRAPHAHCQAYARF
jgi:hypothetical protein